VHPICSIFRYKVSTHNYSDFCCSFTWEYLSLISFLLVLFVFYYYIFKLDTSLLDKTFVKGSKMFRILVDASSTVCFVLYLELHLLCLNASFNSSIIMIHICFPCLLVEVVLYNSYAASTFNIFIGSIGILPWLKIYKQSFICFPFTTTSSRSF